MAKSSEWTADRTGRVAWAHCIAAAAVLIAGCGSNNGSNSVASVGGTSGQPGGVGVNPIVGGGNSGSGVGIGSSGSGVGIGSGSGGVSGQQTSITGVMPCAVENVVKASCQTCHGAVPIGGAPMSLMSLSDFERDYTAQTTKQLLGQKFKMYELAHIRINRLMGTTAMPQSGTLSADQFSTLDGWLNGGAPAGAACAATSTAGTGSVAMGTGGHAPSGMAGTGTVGTMEPSANTQCSDPKAFEPLVANPAENETCWEFRVHGQSVSGDTSKFTVQNGESYNQYYYDVPWPAGSVSTRFGTVFDNKPVLHHWLMFTQGFTTPDGTVSPNVTGTTLLDGGAELIAGWAIGGCSTTYPSDVGVALPDNGTIMLQWHNFNSTGSPQPDGSAAQICTVPAGTRPHTAGLTFLGTEDISIPAHARGDATSTCTNNSGMPITIIGFTPHMHTVGSNMRTVVNHKGGADEEIFNQPFVFDQQINYIMNPPYVLQPGDSLTTTCSWMNNTDATIGFGQSTTSEMCYQFTVSYPNGALNDGVLSLIGATNTCW